MVKRLTNFARRLRTGSTDAERALWSLLRAHRLSGYKFRRQQPIGAYIVDFVSFSRHIVIELDGGQHNEAQVTEYDTARTPLLESQGFRVLRFWDHDALQATEAMLEQVLAVIDGTAPSP